MSPESAGEEVMLAADYKERFHRCIPLVDLSAIKYPPFVPKITLLIFAADDEKTLPYDEIFTCQTVVPAVALIA